MIELCRLAAHDAARRGGSRIAFQDIQGNLENYGRKRIEDLIAEFKSQCAEIEEIVSAFSHRGDLYSTDELISCIKNRVLQAVRPKIAGVVGNATELDIAHFLFQIGFITGRRETSKDSYEHIAFSENPSLLKARTNIDDGLKWEIHPVFRSALNIGHRSFKPGRHG